MKAFVLSIFLSLSCIAAPAFANCAPGTPDVGGYHLWMNVEGSGGPTVVFEAGGGDDSSAWKDIAPAVEKLGVGTVVYDRAGLGHSEASLSAYSIDEEARAFQAALKACGVNGPMIIVAHSYGGFVAELAANENAQVKGLVLIDANIPNYFDDDVVTAILAQYRPQYDALRTQAPQLAKVLIPVIEAYPETVRRMQAVRLSDALPIIDIVAENSWQAAGPWRKAHADFDGGSSRRKSVFASASSHQVMKDRPELVIAAISEIVEDLRVK